MIYNIPGVATGMIVGSAISILIMHYILEKFFANELTNKRNEDH